jgi:hypothetical protein
MLQVHQPRVSLRSQRRQQDQIDAADPQYDKFGLPVCLVSVNPQIPVRESMILNDAGGNQTVANLRHNNLDLGAQHGRGRGVAGRDQRIAPDAFSASYRSVSAHQIDPTPTPNSGSVSGWR